MVAQESSQPTAIPNVTAASGTPHHKGTKSTKEEAVGKAGRVVERVMATEFQNSHRAGPPAPLGMKTAGTVGDRPERLDGYFQAGAPPACRHP